MQLRKRSNHVNYTESVTLTTLRQRRSNSSAPDFSGNSDSEEEGVSDDIGEMSSGLENSDDTVELRSTKQRPPSGSKRKHGAGRDAGKENTLLVYKKRNAGTSDHATSNSSQEGEEDGDGVDDDFAVEKKRKKRKILAEPRARSLRVRKSETVNYKDVSSSDEGELDSKRVFDGSFGKATKGHDSSSELVHDDELPGLPKYPYRKKGASNGKLRRVAAPSIESANSLPGKDGHGDGVKCYIRRFKSTSIVASDDDDDDDQRVELNAIDKLPGRKHGASRNGNSAEQEEEKNGTSGGHVRGVKDYIDASDSDGDQHSKASPVNPATDKAQTKSTFRAVDMFGLRISEDDYGPITKRVNKVEKILAVRNRSSGAAIFCVKLQGKSYRSVVYVLEAQLLKHCPQLLRTFLKRMDLLQRVDGHPGDVARSPAFNPKYLKIDRIVAAEKHNRGTRYFVKWCALSYSESTWERDVDLSSDSDAIKRYNSLKRRKKKSQPAGSSSQLVFNDGRALRDYQEEGVSWLDDKYTNGINCILADEMGLGKTIQSVAMLETLRLKHGIRGPFLVVAPVSTLGHWQREVESLTDMNCVVYTGNQEDREIIRGYEFTFDDDIRSSEMKFNVLLTSFEMLMKDQSKLAKIKWQFIIIDEAHRLKSRESKTTQSLKQMGVSRGGLLLLTGTPVQNNTKEIFSLLNLLDSEKFESEDEFLAKYGDLKNAEQVKDLQENVLRPRLLRRMKEDVEKSIPQKEETIIWVELTREQRVYYRAIYENSVGVLLKGSQGNNIPSLRNVAMELRKVCNHPLLCDGIEEDLISKHSVPKSQQNTAAGGTEPPLVQKLLQQSSGKMVLVDKLLPMLKDAGNRVLIFSQFTMMLDLLEDYLVFKGYTFERIDGKIRGSDRQAAIDRYSAKESDIFVFLLSTRAGGLGITLTAADTCLIYDSDWNPQNDLQAMARCHRIGQTKDVRIYRLITRDTYEQKLFEVSSRKYGLDEAILGNRVGAAGDLEQSVNIESLLKNGAYDMLKDDGDAAAAEFSTQNINEILEHRTEKRLIGGRGVNTFSVATFISQAETEHELTEHRKQKLEKGSEEFWQELLPEAVKASKAAEIKAPPSPGSRRKRARVDYREDPKSVSDDESIEPAGGSGRDSQTEESSVSAGSDEDINSWSEREVKRLEDRLMVLGRNHSRQIQQEAKLTSRDLSQIEQVSDFLFQLCYFAEVNKTTQLSNTSPKSPDMHAIDLNPDEVKTPTDVAEVANGIKGGDPEAVPETLPLHCIVVNDHESGVNYRKDGCLLIGDTRRPNAPICIRKAMKSRSLVDRLVKNSSRYLQILHEREVLALAISKNDPLYFPPKVPVRSKKIPSWWGAQEDRDLLIGIDKHGHREFKKVRMDPTLCFAKRMIVSNELVVINQTDPQLYATIVSPLPPNTASDDGVQGQDWPHESVLTARLKKLMQVLLNSSGAREIHKTIPRSHSKRRTPDASGHAEKSVPVVPGVRGMPVPVVTGVSGKSVMPGVGGKPVPVPGVRGMPVPVVAGVSGTSVVPGVGGKPVPVVAGINVKGLSHEVVHKQKADVEVLLSKTEATIPAKETDILTRKPSLINSDKKEAGIESSRQQRITGYFISKVAVAAT